MGRFNAGSAGIGSFATPAFNGNASGMVWKSKGDGQIRKYDYTYDAPNRLLGADFNQFDGSGFDKNAGIDYSVSGMSYDANGNIGAMNQNAWVIGGSKQIDQLSYQYLNSNVSNRLQYVADNSAYNSSNPSSSLGDFHYAGTKTTGSVDYGYDNNGNLTSDANRAVSSIVYNFLDLPQTITFTNNKGTISYIYDAAGNKLEKTTVENAGTVTYNNTSYPTSITTVTKYIAGFVYQSVSYGNVALASLQTTDQLLFINDEVGRVRALYTNAASPATQTGYAFDYFIRDHLKDVRMVLTDEQWVDTYPAATVESSSIANEENYYSISTGDVVQMSTLSWWPSAGNTSYTNSNPPYSNPGDANSGAQSQSMYHLNASTGDKFGLGITLKVMSGDAVSILGKSVWNNTGSVSEPIQLSSIVNTLLSAFAGTAPVISSHLGATGAALDGSTTITNSLMTTLGTAPTQANPSTAPNAGISWILFNDQFQAISMGTSLVSTTGNSVYTHPQLNVPITTNGYLYVFCSNESNADVYFDNLQVLQTRGPILEEDHYYPVGLWMAGISDHSWNKLLNNYRYQSKEQQDKEFSDGTGLAEDDFGARFYDHQIGRWQTQDPAGQYVNPYLAMGNNWPNGVDKTGMSFWSTIGDIGIILGGTALTLISGGGDLVAAGVLLGGYAGASLASGGHWNPFQWTGDAWKGAIAGELIGGSLAVEGEAFFDPALLAGLGPGGTSVAEGIAGGVLKAEGTTVVTNLFTNQQVFQLNEIFAGAVSGALLGAWNGLNPTPNPDDAPTSYENNYAGLGLKADGFWGNTLYNVVKTVGGSLSSNWIKGNPIFSSVDVPVGPINLTLGQGQVLFNPFSMNNIISEAVNGAGLENALFSGGNADFSNIYQPSYSGGWISGLFSGQTLPDIKDYHFLKFSVKLGLLWWKLLNSYGLYQQDSGVFPY